MVPTSLKVIIVKMLKFVGLICQLLIDLTRAWFLESIDFFISLFDVRQKSVIRDVVVITGGAGGIGQAVANKMAELGAKVALIDINEEAVEAAAQKIRNRSFIAKAFPCDCTDNEALKRVADLIKEDEEFGNADILICCAGYMHAKHILSLEFEGVKKSFDVNVISYFWAIQAFLPHMLQKSRGQVVAVSSIAGHFGQTYSAAYSASKFAIRGLMESLHWELVDMGKPEIKTTTIYPYFTETALLSGISPSSRFFSNLTIDYTARNIVSNILHQKNESFIPSFMSFFCLLIKQTSPGRVKAVWRTFFNVVYFTEAAVLEQNEPLQTQPVPVQIQPVPTLDEQPSTSQEKLSTSQVATKVVKFAKIAALAKESFPMKTPEQIPVLVPSKKISPTKKSPPKETISTQQAAGKEKTPEKQSSLAAKSPKFIHGVSDENGQEPREADFMNGNAAPTGVTNGDTTHQTNGDAASAVYKSSKDKNQDTAVIVSK